MPLAHIYMRIHAYLRDNYGPFHASSARTGRAESVLWRAASADFRTENLVCTNAAHSWFDIAIFDVCIEPHLQPITGEHLSGASANTQDGARLDIAANGLWSG